MKIICQGGKFFKKTLNFLPFSADIRIRIILYYPSCGKKINKRSVFMAIASISGSSSTAPVRTSMEPVKGVKEVESEKKAAEKRVAERENEDKRSKKADSDAKKFEEVKGVKEVDTKA
jgi:hypothetical protein